MPIFYFLKYTRYLIRDTRYKFMLTIRFNRTGKRNKAYFRIVLQEHTIAPGGRHVEVLGSWDPHMKKAVLKSEEIKQWIKKGAQVSDTAWNLFVKEGIVEGKKRAVKMKTPEKVAEETPTEKTENKEESKKEEKPAEEVKTEEVKPEEPKVEEIKKEGSKSEEAAIDNK